MLQPVLDALLSDRQALLQHLEHRLVAVTEGIEAIAQAQCFVRVVEHAAVGQVTRYQAVEQAVGQDAVERLQARVLAAAAQQLEGFHRAIVGDEVVVAVIAPVLLGGAGDQLFQLLAR
ncbi:hypothetical protein D9M68_656900 [compost metagenome]